MHLPHGGEIQGVSLLQPLIHTDARGAFYESWSLAKLRALGLHDGIFSQENCSTSRRGTLRGLHYQSGEHAQSKLIWLTSGRIYDVVVDLRRSSPTYGRWQGRYLDATRLERLFLPAGLAHGFLALENNTTVCYACTCPYAPTAERALRWNDRDLAIEWPIGIGLEPIVSPKDAAAAAIADCEKYS
jgi:dTDP-4-dehydrorhamnose 3,5-epimerase